MLTAELPDAAAKLGLEPDAVPLHVPSCIVIVPAPTVPWVETPDEVVVATPADVTDCTWASWSTLTDSEVGVAELVTEIVAAAVFEEVAVAACHAVGSERLVARVANDEYWDWMLPTAEILELILVACVDKSCSGCFSSATNWLMMLLTLSPLPIPREEIVAIAPLL
jgi:hypothetical protein